MKWLRELAIHSADIGTALFIGGAWLEARMFQLKEVTVPILPAGWTRGSGAARRDSSAGLIADLPRGYARVITQIPAVRDDELRVLHISDIHLMRRQGRKQAFLRSLIETKPDLVIDTGDNISATDSLEPLIESLGGLLDIPGISVLGSNDKHAPTFRNPAAYLFRASTPTTTSAPLPAERMVEIFEDRGWRNLDNASCRLNLLGLTLDFRGTGDAHFDADDYASVAGSPAADADVTIGVTHAPYRRVLDAMSADGLDLIFAGHTHGGQICLPTNRAIIDNCDLPTAQASGLSTWSSAIDSTLRTSYLHVSGGIGTSPKAPFRAFCRPSATLVRLVPRA